MKDEDREAIEFLRKSCPPCALEYINQLEHSLMSLVEPNYDRPHNVSEFVRVQNTTWPTSEGPEDD